MIAVITVFAVNTFSDEFAVVQEIAVQAVFAVLAFTDVITVLQIVAARTHVRVFTVAQQRIVIAIFVGKMEHTHFWHFLHEFSELWKKWSVKIVIPAVFEGIPFVAPPAFQTVYRERFIFPEKGNDYFLAEITLALVQVSFVAESQSALLPAGRAMGWFRYNYFVVESYVLSCYVKFILTIFTGFWHWQVIKKASIYCLQITFIAINYFGSVRRIGGFDWVIAFGAGAVPELSWIT
jgi:hypothetical protein